MIYFRRTPAFILAAILSACVQAPVEPPESAPNPTTTAEMVAVGDIANGQMIAEGFCSGCHATGTEGESTHSAAPPFRTLSQRYPVELLGEALAEGILVGHPDMPEFRFNPDQIDDLLAYLESIQIQQAG